ncbi:hypothetical protein AAFF_G00272380 [Aldrovandia affinis]|uniref:ribonuclease H n=1 Tax=Aldrovandia affinis TaxID=143900 RepID=A0AAD7RDD6_9TELE|nr:hypothetical protein AAFF_G00272380 [Aldrovandia affinis]
MRSTVLAVVGHTTMSGRRVVMVPLSPSAGPKTAFTIGRGLLEFNVIPFGLCNSPATFERLMEKLLQPVLASACMVYLDDILVHASTYMAVLHTVFKLIKLNLCLNLVKCSLLVEDVRSFVLACAMCTQHTNPRTSP